MEFSHLLPHQLEPGPGNPSQFLRPKCPSDCSPRVHMRARGDCHTTEADMKRCPADLIFLKKRKN